MLVKRNPILANIFDELLNDLSIKTNEQLKSKVPAANIKETEKEYILYLAVPGKNKKDFNIDLEKDVLTVSTDSKLENESFSRKEYDFDSFKRSFSLPKDIIDNNEISASYENGELIINLPKKEIVENKPKLIEIK